MLKLKDILIGESSTDPKFVFGNLAFGEDDILAQMQGSSITEPNTEHEQELLDTIALWVGNSSDDLANTLYRNFSLLKRASKIFPKILLPETPIGTMVYRGISVVPSVMKNEIMQTDLRSWEEVTIAGWKHWKAPAPIKYTPNRPIQSWTTSQQVAFDISDDVVLISKQDENYLFNPRFMEEVFGQNEEEIIHFGVQYTEDVYMTVIDRAYRWMLDEKEGKID